MELKIAVSLIIVALMVFPALFIIRRRISRDD
jgi:hypothetical protein